jgi:hypothetical protein
MTKKILTALLWIPVVGSMLTSCDDKAGVPEIDSIWINESSEPLREVVYAYPGQVLCIHGSNLSELQSIVVNSTSVSLVGSKIYDNDNYVTFTLPSYTHISEDYLEYSLTLTTDGGSTVYAPFIVKPKSEKPSISKFSTTTLIAGSELVISGKNLDGVTKVTLPGPFDSRIECQLAETAEQTSTRVTVIIPEGATFATGQAEIVMTKTEYVSNSDGRQYTEAVYSTSTDFTN